MSEPAPLTPSQARLLRNIRRLHADLCVLARKTAQAGKPGQLANITRRQNTLSAAAYKLSGMRLVAPDPWVDTPLGMVQLPDPESPDLYSPCTE